MPLARPEIVMGRESQTEAWSAYGLRRRAIVLSQAELASSLDRQSVFWRVTSRRFLAGSGTSYLMGGRGGLGARSNGTEVGKGALSTPRFVEGSPSLPDPTVEHEFSTKTADLGTRGYFDSPQSAKRPGGRSRWRSPSSFHEKTPPQGQGLRVTLPKAVEARAKGRTIEIDSG
jgi:hypothetical protein